MQKLNTFLLSTALAALASPALAGFDVPPSVVPEIGATGALAAVTVVVAVAAIVMERRRK